MPKKAQIKPVLYIPAVLVFSWIPWFLAVSTGRGMENLAVKVLLLVGLLVPGLVAIIFMSLGEEAEYHWDYWRRVFDPGLISRNSYLLIFFLPVIITLGAILISFFFGESVSQFRIVPQVRAHIPSLIVYIFYIFFVSSFPQELGWRGYWLDKLKNHLSGLRASLLISVVWVFWHFPLFMVKGHSLESKADDPLLVAFYLLNLFPISVILTYLFIKNQRSTLAAILFHFMIAFSGQLFELPPLTEGLKTTLYLLVAIYLVVRNKKLFR
ncbi:MAG: CPBP family intramembrane metalloprotease [Acidobacteriota bacterium]|nr:CPBP family intramembrane metalloprotease [Acidobacteriota bacterium]MDW3229005.1 CPBP family intramembrane metalloprotease [Acidobacteriota bacterium]MDY0231100.1 CPBP family intramembrane glutamic endopeptidase [Candidatus Saccharicenans sp.]